MSDVSSNLETTFALHEAGVRVMREHLRRQDPAASEEEIERRLARWLMERPGAEQGDAAGRPRAWPPG